ncbi:MAG TPA: glycosyltransferase family 2 protein [Anaerolineae bacterium]|nr:glycosyltransferase family 2 protein [Anaerolineae bacterium]HQH38546.1 glycosyltransferase family 2 protein [Anaerolineae bacterium]
MKASVIIPVWNGREYLSECIDALWSQTYSDFEIIVVDNASVDGSADFIAEKYPPIRLARNAQNLGFSGGCNVGLRVAEGDVLVLLNQDTRVQPGWLQALVKVLQRPEIGVAGCKILYPDGQTIQHAGGWIEWPLGLAHHYGQGERDVGQWDNACQVEYVTGAALAFRRDTWKQVGFLDEAFWPGYFEDVDFCFRVRDAGVEVWYVPEAVVIHAESTSLTDLSKISSYYQQGRLRFILKHLSPFRFLAEFVPAEREYQPAAIRGQESGSLLTAYLRGVSMAPQLLRCRWQAPEDVNRAVYLALRELYERAWAEEGKRLTEHKAGVEMGLASSGYTVVDTLPLQEFEFRSRVPVVGPLIAGFRSWWYSMAARWAIRDLIRQQSVINHQQSVINRQQSALNHQQEVITRFLEQQVAVLMEENGFLAYQIACLNCDKVQNDKVW